MPRFLSTLSAALLLAPVIAGAQEPITVRPTAWYNDAGGVTLGARFGRSLGTGRATLLTGWSTGLAAPGDAPVRQPQLGFSWRDPLQVPGSRVERRVDGSYLDGRSVIAISARDGDRLGYSLRWLAVHDDRFLDPAQWDVGGTLELPVWLGREGTHGDWLLGARGSATGAVEYRRPGDGITTERRYDMQPWARGELMLSARRPIGAFALGVQLRHAATIARDPILPQRRLFVAGADPYQEFDNPFVRSAGAPLVRGEMAGHWHSAGGGNLRGFDRALSADRLTTLNVEIARTIFTSSRPIISQLSIVLFGDAGWLGAERGVGGESASLALRVPVKEFLMDAGAGIRGRHTLFGFSFTSRLELPLYVNDAPWAASSTGERLSATRWLIGIAPVIR